MPERLARRIAGVAVASLVVGVEPGRGRPCADERCGTSLDPQNFAQIERGRYLAVAGDCASCHTAPGSGQPFAGGRPIETPFGVVVGANITPDRETGIGAWSDELFVSALREGKGHGGTLLYPAMPYPVLHQGDRTRRARDSRLPQYGARRSATPSSPTSCLSLSTFARKWRSGTRSISRAANSSRTRRNPPSGIAGPILSKVWGIAAPAIRPRRRLAATIDTHALQGYALQGWFAPNITNDNERGLGGWSVADIVSYLKTGHNAVSGRDGNHGARK